MTFKKTHMNISLSQNGSILKSEVNVSTGLVNVMNFTLKTPSIVFNDYTADWVKDNILLEIAEVPTVFDGKIVVSEHSLILSELVSLLNGLASAGSRDFNGTYSFTFKLSVDPTKN